MQAVLFCLSQNFEDVYRAEAIVISNSRGDCYANMGMAGHWLIPKFHRLYF